MENFENIKDEDLIFALDIGTRSVIGIVGYKKDSAFKLIAVEKQEYTSRVVIDGQIDDIAETAITADIVKKRLELSLNRTLTSVYIAAAGRSLMTEQVVAEMSVDKEIITEDFVKKLEFSAVEQAIEKLAEENDRSYYYVGHTVQKYILDEYTLTSLVDHKGDLARAFIIATFLPQEVVESLCATMKRIGLKISGLTLEPIAAMNVIIPNEIRKLNLALCDIGAGTSDIAICKQGSVIGYTMATIAGDEITEALMENCLVDFSEAERMKFSLSDETIDIITFTNVLGIEDNVPREALLLTLNNTIKKLADTICERIVEMNGQPPAAIFLAGGGSQTPHLSRFIAEKLEIDYNKVAIGSNIYMKKLVESDIDVFKPEFATPLGIAVTAVQEVSSNTFNVKLNGQIIHLFNLVDTSVYAILQVSGYKYTDLVGKIGKNLHFVLNGENKIIRGEIASPAEIFINENLSSLGDIVLPGDNVTFSPASNGSDARYFVSNLTKDEKCHSVTINGKIKYAGKIVKVNGVIANNTTEIFENDQVETEHIRTLEDLKISLVECTEQHDLYVNSSLADDDYILCDGDDIQIIAKSNTRIAQTKTKTPKGTKKLASTSRETKSETKPTTDKTNATPKKDLSQTNPLEVSDKKVPEKIVVPTPVEPVAPSVTKDVPEQLFEDILKDEAEEPIADNSPVIKTLNVTINNKKTSLAPKPDGSKYMFFDMLAFTNIDPSKPEGDIVLRLNGTEPTYLQEILNNDVIEIYWDKK